VVQRISLFLGDPELTHLVDDDADPVTDTIRGLLAGTPAASDVAWAISWLLAIAVVGYAWSLWLYRRRATGR
jgi:hypothetical protein